MIPATTPCGIPMTARSLRDTDTEYAPARAFHLGANAYLLGQPESSNPWFDGHLSDEWRRGYRNTRADDRFRATIAKRRAQRASPAPT
jgi:hypothetical protein